MLIGTQLLWLAGCANEAGCNGLALREYDRSFELRVADELEAAPADSALARAVVDYAALRGMVRACRSG